MNVWLRSLYMLIQTDHLSLYQDTSIGCGFYVGLQVFDLAPVVTSIQNNCAIQIVFELWNILLLVDIQVDWIVTADWSCW